MRMRLFIMNEQVHMFVRLKAFLSANFHKILSAPVFSLIPIPLIYNCESISELHIFGTYNCFPRNLADNLISGSFFLPESVSQLWVLLTIYFWKDRKNVLKFATDFYPYIKLYLFRQIATFFLYIASKHRRPSINVSL